jgi:hypoxanthine phosphoribosyltransferase
MTRSTAGPAYMLSITWDGLAEVCRDLATRVAQEFQPDVVVGVARMGTLPGALLAMLLRCDFQSLRSPVPDLPETVRPHQPIPELLAGRRVLIVDEVARDGAALRRVANELRMLGAREVRTLVLFSSPDGGRTDYSGPEIPATVLQPWVRDTAMVDEAIRRTRYPHGQV